MNLKKTKRILFFLKKKKKLLIIIKKLLKKLKKNSSKNKVNILNLIYFINGKNKIKDQLEESVNFLKEQLNEKEMICFQLNKKFENELELKDKFNNDIFTENKKLKEKLLNVEADIYEKFENENKDLKNEVNSLLELNEINKRELSEMEKKIAFETKNAENLETLQNQKDDEYLNLKKNMIKKKIH